MSWVCKGVKKWLVTKRSKLLGFRVAILGSVSSEGKIKNKYLNDRIPHSRSAKSLSEMKTAFTPYGTYYCKQ